MKEGPRLYEFVDALYKEHAAELTAALALSTNDRAAAEDLAHETFLRAMEREESLRAHPNPRAWLFTTGYNLARNRWRLLTRRRHAVARERPVLDPATWAESVDLRDSLGKLSSRQRDAVVLHHYLGFSVGEIAEMLGCAEGTVKSHLYRGREALEALLSPKEATQ